MPEGLHQQRHCRPPLQPLPVAPRLTQRVAAVIALEPHMPTPSLYHCAHRRHRQHPPLALKQKLAIALISAGQPPLNRLYHRLVKCHLAVLIRLGLLHRQHIAHSERSHLTYPNREQLVRPKRCVDSQRKQAQITRLVPQ